ncbi:hypothetical protein BGX28_001501 [Mortierella sp. GBA30]|nr:hypothetical protein BGX28_001501 [Mortierella sp. GBA30]
MAVAIVAIANEFQYSKSQQGLILASFFIGYIITPIIGGALADRHGGKSVLAFGAAMWTLFTFLTPVASRMGLAWIVLVRISLGLGEGVAYPSVHALIGTWVPPCERSKAVATVTAFSYLGAVVALPTSSALVVSPWGWRSIFWVFGALGFLWNIAWQIWGASDPLSCRGISRHELEWIVEQQKFDQNTKSNRDLAGQETEEHVNEHDRTRTISANGVPTTYLPLSTSAAEQNEIRHSEDTSDETQVSRLRASSEEHELAFGADAPTLQQSSLRDSDQEASKTTMTTTWRNFRNRVRSVVSHRKDLGMVKTAVPWKELLISREVWAIIISQSWIPTFYLDFYGVDVGKIGYFAVLPSAVQGTTGFVAGYLGDKAIRDWEWKPLTVRRMGQTIGSVGLGIFLLLAVNLAHTAAFAMTLITIGMALNGFTMIGASAYQHDFCPQHAGFIFSLGNTAGSIPALAGVFLVGLLLDKDKVNQWGLIWTTVCFFYFLGATLFAVMATSRRLPVFVA